MISIVLNGIFELQNKVNLSLGLSAMTLRHTEGTTSTVPYIQEIGLKWRWGGLFHTPTALPIGHEPPIITTQENE